MSLSWVVFRPCPVKQSSQYFIFRIIIQPVKGWFLGYQTRLGIRYTYLVSYIYLFISNEIGSYGWTDSVIIINTLFQSIVNSWLLLNNWDSSICVSQEVTCILIGGNNVTVILVTNFILLVCWYKFRNIKTFNYNCSWIFS